MAASGEITQLLLDWRNGNQAALNRLFPLVYDELRGLAHGVRRRSSDEDSLRTTGLVHEAYLKLVDQTHASIHDRGHFFALAARAMRQILVDHARARGAQKRGDGVRPATFEEWASDDARRDEETRLTEIIAVDELLAKLDQVDHRLVELVEMRYFGGLSVEETAETLGVSARTVKRDWQKARAWMWVELTRGSS
jgi:RNA polymerase sigma factor (TIGR02999 family)